MKGKKELFMLILGLVLYIVDMATDIYVALQYKRAGEYGWFAWTLTFIIIPLLITSVVAWRQLNKKKGCMKYIGLYLIIPSVSIFFRFKEEFEHWGQTYQKNCPCGENYKECNCRDCKKYRKAISAARKSAYSFAWLRYVETFTESIPQWILQAYIMLSQLSFPWYTVLSASFSFLSLAWSNTALEKARVIKDGHSFGWKVTVLHFTSQLFVLGTRVFVLVMFLYSQGPGGFSILVIFWSVGCFFLMLLTCGYTICTMCCGDAPCCETSLKKMYKKLMLSFLLTFYVSEAVLETLGFHSIAVKIFFHVIKCMENFFLAPFVLRAFPQYNYILVPVMFSLLGTSSLFGLIALVVRHIIHRREQSQDNPNTTNAQSNAYYLPEPGTTSATNRALQV